MPLWHEFTFITNEKRITMKRSELNRRDFTRLTLAAFGGVVTGSMVGCSSKTETDETTQTSGTPAEIPQGNQEEETTVANPWTSDTHICRGLNACKGKGVNETGDKPGTGECATIAKHHTCHADNDCKYQGGCQESVGQNDCNGKGECGVPLSDDSWKKARAAFEKAMKTAGTEFGDSPTKKES